jgi:hypothetical protein
METSDCVVAIKTWAQAFGKRGRGYEAYRFLYWYLPGSATRGNRT